MSEVAWFLTAGFGLLVVLGFPFAIAIALAITGALLAADIEPAFLAQSAISGAQQFSLLAIPLFMLAGELMAAGGLSQRLVEFAGTLVRHRTGGLAMVTVLAALVFSAISGSAPATTAAIGAIMIPAMVEAGYDRGFAASIAVSAGVLGPLIPPSIAFVIWGIVAEQSIGRLFLSGIVPGVVLAIGLLAVCWAHARRQFFELADIAANARRGRKAPAISPIALEAVRRIDELFEIERTINGLSAEERRRIRQAQSAPLLTDLEEWLRDERSRLSRSALVLQPIDYMLRRWDRFAGFVEDGRICLTNNAAERALRGFALGRKAWLFAGSERGAERAAAMTTLIATAKLNDVDPLVWLADVLARIAGTPQSRLPELLPWNWNTPQDRQAAA